MNSKTELSGVEMAAGLCTYLPQSMVAQMTDRSRSTVSSWVQGKSVPTDASRDRLAMLLEICEAVHDPKTPWIARSWFMGLNPNLGYDRPMERILAGDAKSVMNAALEFRRQLARPNPRPS